MSRKKRSFAQEVCVKSAGKAMQMTGMLWPGCRVGVAASGGVDSFVLLKTLKIRQGIVPFRFEIMALHLNPGFDDKSHAALLPWLAEHGIPAHLEVTSHGPDAHSEKNLRRSACGQRSQINRVWGRNSFSTSRQFPPASSRLRTSARSARINPRAVADTLAK